MRDSPSNDTKERTVRSLRTVCSPSSDFGQTCIRTFSLIFFSLCESKYVVQPRSVCGQAWNPLHPTASFQPTKYCLLPSLAFWGIIRNEVSFSRPPPSPSPRLNLCRCHHPIVFSFRSFPCTDGHTVLHIHVHAHIRSQRSRACVHARHQ